MYVYLLTIGFEQLHTEDPINIVVPIKVSLHLLNFISKTKKQNKISFCVFILFLQEINSDKKDEALNFIFPGCLNPFKDEICSMLGIEKRSFLANRRFNAAFSNITLMPLFQNRKNEKLISRSKIN